VTDQTEGSYPSSCSLVYIKDTSIPVNFLKSWMLGSYLTAGGNLLYLDPIQLIDFHEVRT